MKREPRFGRIRDLRHTPRTSSHALNIRQRLELFMTNGAAVDVAHRHLVVHRDLKRSNPGERRRSQAAGFSVAKLLESGGYFVPGESTRTAQGVRLTGISAFNKDIEHRALN
jgi:hypothetical protein